jgi:hypothetical protein
VPRDGAQLFTDVSNYLPAKPSVVPYADQDLFAGPPAGNTFGRRSAYQVYAIN